MAKVEFDTILRCANANCCHNQNGYKCACVVITLNNEGQCALCKPKSIPKDAAVAPNKSKPASDVETSK